MKYRIYFNDGHALVAKESEHFDQRALIEKLEIGLQHNLLIKVSIEDGSTWHINPHNVSCIKELGDEE